MHLGIQGTADCCILATRYRNPMSQHFRPKLLPSADRFESVNVTDRQETNRVVKLPIEC